MSSAILRENARRAGEKRRRHDPITGEGCVGDRFSLPLKGVPKGYPETLFLPVEMEELPVVERIRSYGGDIRKLVGSLPSGCSKGAKGAKAFLLYLSDVRCRYDFEYFAVSHQTIRDKETGRRVRFVLNPPQRRLIAELERQRRTGRQIRVMVLKARQMGFSTAVQMYMNWIQMCVRENWNSVVCAHELSQAAKVRAMYEGCLKEMPPLMGKTFSYAPYAGTQSTKQVPERGCTITVGTALNPDSVRGEDVKMVHFSEEAYYPTTEANNPGLLETSIIASIPTVSETMIVRESTANGVGGFFHDQWQRAKRGETAYVPFFAAWYELPIYEVPLDGTFYLYDHPEPVRGTAEDFAETLTEWERGLFENHPLCTLENLNWYRAKYNTLTDRSKMRQEFPSDDVEAFLSSGSPVFRVEDVERLRGACRPPLMVGDLVGDGEPGLAVSDPRARDGVLRGLHFVPDKEALRLLVEGTERDRLRAGLGRLQVWAEPSPEPRMRDRYVVAFDPQRGVSEGADYGVIKVLDREPMGRGEVPEVVALFYGHLDKDVTAWVAVQIATWYECALLVIESNTYDSSYRGDDGEFIFDTIARYYDNLYSRTPADKIREGFPRRYGWQTNRSTKPILVNTFRALLREGGYVERDAGTLDEVRAYETKQDGSMGAVAGGHDDRVMATMLALYVAYEMEPPRAIVPGRQIGERRIFIPN